MLMADYLKRKKKTSPYACNISLLHMYIYKSVHIALYVIMCLTMMCPVLLIVLNDFMSVVINILYSVVYG